MTILAHKRSSRTALLNGALSENMSLPSICQTKEKEIFGFIYPYTEMTLLPICLKKERCGF
jgi:hypothetical protein